MANHDSYIIKLTNCPSCQSKNIKPFYKDETPTSNNDKSFDYYLFEDMGLSAQPIVYDFCYDCGLLFLNPRWNDAALGRMYGSESLYRRAGIRARSNGAYSEELYKNTLKQMDPGIENPKYVHTNVESEIKWIKQNVALKKEGLVVADIGAGWGRAQHTIKLHGFDYIGFESAPELVDLAKSLDRNVECVPFAELPKRLVGEADILFTHHFLEHVDAPVECLKLLRSCIKPDGYLFIAVPSFRFFTTQYLGGLRAQLMNYPKGARLYMNWGHMSHYYHVSLKNLLIRSGFEPISYTYADRNIYILGQKTDHVKTKPEKPNSLHVSMDLNVISPTLAWAEPHYKKLINVARTILRPKGKSIQNSDYYRD